MGVEGKVISKSGEVQRVKMGVGIAAGDGEMVKRPTQLVNESCLGLFGGPSFIGGLTLDFSLEISGVKSGEKMAKSAGEELEKLGGALMSIGGTFFHRQNDSELGKRELLLLGQLTEGGGDDVNGFVVVGNDD